jgi:subtilisin family serine protease
LVLRNAVKTGLYVIRRGLARLAALSLLGASVCAWAQSAAGGEFEWRFSIKANQTASSNITAHNVCRQPHRFEIVTQELPSFMRLLGAAGFQVQPLGQSMVPVQFDSTGLSLGMHEGRVTIHCLTCRTEKTCSQDYQRLHIFMTVEAPASPAGVPTNPATGLNTLATAPKPTPVPGQAQGVPTPTPAASPKQTVQPALPTPNLPLVPVPSEVQPNAKRGSYVPGRVLAVISGDAAQSAEDAARKLAQSQGLDLLRVDPLRSIHAALVTFRLRQGNDVPGKVAALLPYVMLAQPDFVYETSDDEEEEAARDSINELQYGPRLIGVDRLRGSLTGQGVKIALIDTGVDAKHPALHGKIAGEADMTGKGFTADVHATLLAGIISADGKKSGGVSGVAPGAEILAVKSCQPLTAQGAAAQCWSMSLARGLDFAIENKASVINMSLGGPPGTEEKILKRMIEEAVSRGALVVAAAGNDGADGKPGFPAALSSVVAVTAVDSKDQLYSSATQGDFVDLAAPGVEILSTSPGGKVLVSSGTSLAAAFVSGAAALALQQQPRLSPAAVQALLERTAKDLGPHGKDRQFGYGRVDACRAIADLKHDTKLCR